MKLIELKPNLYINPKKLVSIEVKKTEYKPERDIVVVRFGHDDECILYFSDTEMAQKKAATIASKVSFGDIDEI